MTYTWSISEDWAKGFLMEIIGRGRFSEVRKDGDIVVKTISTDDQRAPHNWRAEIDALRLIKNDRVITLLDVVEKLEKMEPYVALTFQYYPYTLESVIYHYSKANFPPNTGFRNAMPIPRVTEIFCGIAEGLASAHENGIIHRDLKPENILFSSYESQPVLIDFGIAYVPNISKERCEDKIIDVATAEYKPPEVLYGCKNYTEKLDIWSLGCILAQLMSPTSTVLFSPYTSDITLISSQIEELGLPDIAKCPSLQNTVAENLNGSKTSTSIDAIIAKDEKLGKLLVRMLDYEWTNRPSAAEIVSYLKN